MIQAITPESAGVQRIAQQSLSRVSILPESTGQIFGHLVTFDGFTYPFAFDMVGDEPFVASDIITSSMNNGFFGDNEPDAERIAYALMWESTSKLYVRITRDVENQPATTDDHPILPFENQTVYIGIFGN